jgi:hypothetical protein
MKRTRIYIGHRRGKCAFAYHGYNWPIGHVRNTILGALKALDISGATLISAEGVWEGETEDVTIIELLDNGGHNVLAKALMKELQQDSVLVTTEDVLVEFISQQP